MRSDMEVWRDPSLERQRIHRRQQADRRRRRPERPRLGLKDEASGRGADQPAELPGEAGERHVAAEQPRFRQIHDEWRIDCAVQAFAEGEHRDRDAEDDGRLSSREPGAADEHCKERSGPDHSHEREPPQAALALDELHDGQLPERDASREDEPEHPDRGLAHVRGVLRERREELTHHRDPRSDEDDVEDDEAKKDAIAEHVGVAAGLVVRLDVARCGDEPQHRHEDEKRRGVEQEEEREGAGVGRACNCAGDQTAECDAEVHRHPLLREGGMSPVPRCERAQEGGLARPEGSAAESDERVQGKGLPRVANEREESECDGHHDQGATQNSPRSEPVGERAPDES